MSSITREVTAGELQPLVNATRSPEDVETDALDGDELDALLSSERAPQPPAPPIARPAPPPAAPIAPPAPPAPPSAPAAPLAAPSAQAAAPPNVIATNTPSAQASAVFTTGERPRVAIPSQSAEAPVVLAPELITPPPPPPPSAPIGPTAGISAPPAPPVAMPISGPILPVLTPAPPSRSGLYFVLGGASLLAVALGIILFGLRAEPDPQDLSASAPPAPSSSSPPAAPPPVLPSSSASPSSRDAPSPSAAASPPPGTPEADARAALVRLRDGIGTCVRDVIGVLPGTSPAIPPAFRTLARGPYKSAPRDFRSPVFSCAKYRESEPQRFQIQWQLVKRPRDGLGVAWIDDDADGKPDRAFGFHATFLGKNQVELGEIAPLTPMPPTR